MYNLIEAQIDQKHTYWVRIGLGQFDEVFLNPQFGAVPVQLSDKRSFPRLFRTFFSNINNNIIK